MDSMSWEIAFWVLYAYAGVCWGLMAFGDDGRDLEPALSFILSLIIAVAWPLVIPAVALGMKRGAK